jgi:hypothetical protein
LIDPGRGQKKMLKNILDKQAVGCDKLWIPQQEELLDQLNNHRQVKQDHYILPGGNGLSPDADPSSGQLGSSGSPSSYHCVTGGCPLPLPSSSRRYESDSGARVS